MYKSLYDEKHRFWEISASDADCEIPHQKGIREKLFCGECEQIFSRYERYASLVLNGGAKIETRLVGDNQIFIKGVDYSDFKLFQLSIIWRASVSKSSMFGEVNLGRHEEIIRLMLLKKCPGENYQYPVLLSPIIHENDVVEALIVKPTYTRIDGQNAYRFVFGGIAWIFVVSSHKPAECIIEAALNQSGVLKLIPRKLSDMNFIVEMAKEMNRSHKGVRVTFPQFNGRIY